MVHFPHLELNEEAINIIMEFKNDVRCEFPFQNIKTQKWGVRINLYIDNKFDKTLAISEPSHESKDQAVLYVRSFIENIRKH